MGSSLLSKFLNIDQSGSYSLSEERRMRLVMIADVLAILSYSLYIILYSLIDFKDLYPEIINLAFCADNKIWKNRIRLRQKNAQLSLFPAGSAV